MSFALRLVETARANQSFVCLGLDPDPARMPGEFAKMPPTEAARDFCLHAIEATKGLVAAYKPNSAFFEALGAEGWRAMHDVVRAGERHAPVILDAKRGDIGTSAAMYAKAAFETLGASALTVNPYMGADCVEAFTSHKRHGVFLLCRTSNPGGRDFQELPVKGVPLYEHVAAKALEWNVHGNVGLVVGATVPEQMAEVRRVVGEEIPLLVPGVGTQGGHPRDVMTFGTNGQGERVLVNASRSILYAGEGRARDQRLACDLLREELNKYRPKPRA